MGDVCSDFLMFLKSCGRVLWAGALLSGARTFWVPYRGMVFLFSEGGNMGIWVPLQKCIVVGIHSAVVRTSPLCSNQGFLSERFRE